MKQQINRLLLLLPINDCLTLSVRVFLTFSRTPSHMYTHTYTRTHSHTHQNVCTYTYSHSHTQSHNYFICSFKTFQATNIYRQPSVYLNLDQISISLLHSVFFFFFYLSPLFLPKSLNASIFNWESRGSSNYRPLSTLGSKKGRLKVLVSCLTWYETIMTCWLFMNSYQITIRVVVFLPLVWIKESNWEQIQPRQQLLMWGNF